MPLDSTMPCLCCNTVVLIDSVAWAKLEQPVALCVACSFTVPPAVVRILYVLRCQVTSMGNDLVRMKRDIENLFEAQKDLEQDLLRTET